MFGCVKSVLHRSRKIGPSTRQGMSERRATSFAGIWIWRQCRLASAMVAPNTTRSSLAQSALAMHIGHGSQVEYIVKPARDGRFNFLQASRTVRVSAWELGSLSRRTALVPRISRSPLRVFTISAPNGTGWGVSRARAVNWKISRMRSSSIADRSAADFARGAMRQFITWFGRTRQGLHRIFIWNALGGWTKSAACYSSGLTALSESQYEQICFSHLLPSLGR
jgi:hypothetical protein